MIYKDLDKKRATRRAYYQHNKTKILLQNKQSNERHKESRKSYCKQWRLDNLDHVKEVSKTYYEENKNRLRPIRRAWQKNNPEKCVKYSEEYRKRHPEKAKLNKSKSSKKWRAKNKDLVFTHYSALMPFCACCNETTYDFLTIDHINNDGAKHRKEANIHGGSGIYYWLVKNNYPEGYQILCANCNFGKRMNGGVCPHKQK